MKKVSHVQNLHIWGPKVIRHTQGQFFRPFVATTHGDGQIFDAYAHIISLIKQAKHSIVLIDNYIDENTLVMLSKRNASVSAAIYTRQLSQQQQLDLQRHNQQYPPIAINSCQHNHDRFLIIDDVVYIFGASLKDAGKKLFAYIRMQETSATELLNNIR